MRTWQFQEAKSNFFELVREARTHGPQYIAVNGHEEVVLISTKEFEKLKKPRLNLAEFIRQSPLFGSGIDLNRDGGPGRVTPFESPS